MSSPNDIEPTEVAGGGLSVAAGGSRWTRMSKTLVGVRNDRVLIMQHLLTSNNIDDKRVVTDSDFDPDSAEALGMALIRAALFARKNQHHAAKTLALLLTGREGQQQS